MTEAADGCPAGGAPAAPALRWSSGCAVARGACWALAVRRGARDGSPNSARSFGHGMGGDHAPGGYCGLCQLEQPHAVIAELSAHSRTATGRKSSGFRSMPGRRRTSGTHIAARQSRPGTLIRTRCSTATEVLARQVGAFVMMTASRGRGRARRASCGPAWLVACAPGAAVAVTGPPCVLVRRWPVPGGAPSRQCLVQRAAGPAAGVRRRCNGARSRAS